MDYKMLKDVIASSGIKYAVLAQKIGISRASLYYKLNGLREFTVGEAEKLCDAIGLSDARKKSHIFLERES